MFNKLRLRTKLFIYFTFVFVIFTSLILVFQYQREKNFRTSQLENTLDTYAEFTHNYIRNYHLTDSSDLRHIDEILPVLPKSNIRITVINTSGEVLYDSEYKHFEDMENHLHRPEVTLSKGNHFGSSIRESATTGNAYYYFAKFYTDYYIRTAAIYDVEVRDFLQIEKLFIVYLVLLFVVIWIILLLIIRNIGSTITKLKDFAIKLNNGENVDDIHFPSHELGQISSQVASIYNDLNETKKEMKVEKDKLYNHLRALNEGIAFFTPDKQKVLTNSHFIQYLNVISEQSSVSAEKIFTIKELKPITQFIDKHLNSDKEFSSSILPKKEYSLFKGDKYFHIRCIFFQDRNFEIVITDTTENEKENLIKQQMTSNIAHELKTPVTTVMGYLETLKATNLEPEKQQYFIDKAFLQAKRLSDLVGDISTLSKIEEAQSQFELSDVNINVLVDEVSENLKIKLDENKVNVHTLFAKEVIVTGNRSLLFSIFHNLFDNAIKYGGHDIHINITNYLEDNDFYYFSFSNTGNTIEDKHFPRLFERFYRIDSGRTRKSGGTGLGLAIVKNAVQLHGGEINAKTYKGGGVEFLFTIAK